MPDHPPDPAHAGPPTLPTVDTSRVDLLGLRPRPEAADETLGRFRLLGKLGRGGMGVVYRGHDPDLDRPLALKVMRPFRGDEDARAGAEERFVREAQVGGRLQHPGIVPVYELGRTSDGRPFLAMKLVEGRTLADLLAERPRPADELPRWVQVFEQICQAVAYAHSQGVVHRDLKPQNVMVGAFGEVQVMDWGIAKVLGLAENAPAAGGPSTSTAGTEATPSSNPSTRGAGTPAYMPPEQVAGAADLDARADVFGLGGILCVILTGKPPYTGAVTWQVCGRAIHGDLDETFARLDGCGADAELVALAKACLATDRGSRPPNAGAVAETVSAYRAGVAERLRRAELERAAAAAREAEERKRRWLRRMLAAAALLAVLLAGAGAAWYAQHRAGLRRETERELDLADESLRQGRWGDAREALGRAEAILGRGGPAVGWPRLDAARGLLAWVDELDRIRQDRLAVVEDKLNYAVAAPRYAASFGDRGLTVGEADPAEVAAFVRASPVRGPLVAALDDWLSVDDARREALLAVLRQADPDGPRTTVREATARRDGPALRELATAADVRELSPAILVALAEGLFLTGNRPEAVGLLRRARDEYRADFWAHFQLANYLGEYRKPTETVEAEGCYRAALALRPDSIVAHFNLGTVLQDRQDLPGAEKAFRAALALDPNFAMAHSNLGMVWYARKDWAAAEREFVTALDLDPNLAPAHLNLGNVLFLRKDLAGAEKEYREAIRLNRRLGKAYYGLGKVFEAKKNRVGAEKAYRAAVTVAPQFAPAQIKLGILLGERQDLTGAEKAFRAALAADPDLADGHYNLGNILGERSDLAGAEKAYRTAIALNPQYAEAHCNLGHVLREGCDFRGALAAQRRGHELGSKRPGWPHPSAEWVRQAERDIDLDARLPAVLAGTARPATVAEVAEFARLCMLPGKRQYAASARLFGDAFISDPKLAANLQSGDRYSAATAAARAAAGEGADAPATEADRARLRREAIAWLRADLAAWAKLARAKPAAARLVAAKLRQWQRAADLAGVRAPAALAKLPEAERNEWQQLWADVADLLARVAPEPLPPPRPAPSAAP